MKLKLKACLIALSFSLPVLPTIAVADSFPQKTITIINPYDPGGTADLQARFIAEYMEKDLGVTVNVESRSGGAGAIGMNHLKAAKPNGYTIGITAIGPALVTPNRVNTGYDTTKDYAPIAQISNTPYSLSVHKSSSSNSVADLIEKSKEKNLSYGTTGAGLHTHLMFENFFNEQGAQTRHIPSKGGTGTKNALLGQHIDAAAISIPDIVPYYLSKDFKVLGISSEERVPELPDVPTFKEQGYDLVSGAWFGFLAPKGTPDDVVEILEKSIESALLSEKVAENFKKLGLDVEFKKSDDFEELIIEEDEKIKKILSK